MLRSFNIRSDAPDLQSQIKNWQALVDNSKTLPILYTNPTGFTCANTITVNGYQVLYGPLVYTWLRVYAITNITYLANQTLKVPTPPLSEGTGTYNQYLQVFNTSDTQSKITPNSTGAGGLINLATAQAGGVLTFTLSGWYLRN